MAFRPLVRNISDRAVIGVITCLGAITNLSGVISLLGIMNFGVAVLAVYRGLTNVWFRGETFQISQQNGVGK